MTRLLALLALTVLAGCATLPDPPYARTTHAVAPSPDTRLGEAAARASALHPGTTGIHPLPVARDAFAARVLLADAAQRSLDVQYYIWHPDTTGMLLLEALVRAADRGVRVRLLLDDNGTAGLGEELAALSAHPQVEVRLYNPFAHRNLRSLDFFVDFARVNRRMHNKAFLADGSIAIVGGRNIGDEYLGAARDVAFTDLDVVAVGPVVGEIAAAFDLYWNSASSYAAAPLLPAPPADARASLQARFAQLRAEPGTREFQAAIAELPLLDAFLRGTLVFDWTKVVLLRDDPAKTREATPATSLLLLPALLEAAGRPQRWFYLVSPYFVPGAKGTADLAALARSGVSVRVLTNSLAATDVGAVHAGYAKRRHDLLAAGVRLYELKPSLRQDDTTRRTFGSASSSSLHAKTFALDDSRVFVGSFNFDPRSALLNTEMGLLIDSPRLVRDFVRSFDRVVAEDAWEVRLAADGGLEWIESSATGVVRHRTEPGTTAGQRAIVEALSILPIDWLL